MNERGVSTVLALVAVLTLAVCGFAGHSMYQKAQAKAEGERISQEAQVANERFTQIRRQWQDALQLASNTPRIGLAGPIGKLQALRQDVQAVKVPACLIQSREHLVAGMNAALEGLMAFMRNDLDKWSLEELTDTKMAAMQTEFAAQEEKSKDCSAPKA